VRQLWQHRLGVLPSPLRGHVPAPPPPVHQRQRAALQGILWINNLRPEPSGPSFGDALRTPHPLACALVPAVCVVVRCVPRRAFVVRACVCIHTPSSPTHIVCLCLSYAYTYTYATYALTRRTLSNALYLNAVCTIFRFLCVHYALYTIFRSCAVHYASTGDAMCAVHCCLSHILSLYFTVLLLASNRQPANIGTSLQGPKDKRQGPRRTVD
jgi:hypothetical protein